MENSVVWKPKRWNLHFKKNKPQSYFPGLPLIYAKWVIFDESYKMTELQLPHQ